MQKFLNVFLLVLLFSLFGASQSARTQGLAGNFFAVSPGVTLTTCESNSITGFTNVCTLSTGQQYYCLNTTTTCGTSAAGWVLDSGVGATGPQGPTGATGATGATGPQGPAGTSTSGVSSIQICNAAGTSCGTAVAGAVILDIPKTAATTLN